MTTEFLSEDDFEVETSDCVVLQLEDIPFSMPLDGVACDNGGDWLVNGAVATEENGTAIDRVYIKLCREKEWVYLEVCTERKDQSPVPDIMIEALLKEAHGADVARILAELAEDRWPHLPIFRDPNAEHRLTKQDLGLGA